MRPIFLVLFGLWGGLGFCVIFLEVMATNTMASVGVGQSAFVMMHLLWYIAGTVFFGMGALISLRPN